MVYGVYGNVPKDCMCWCVKLTINTIIPCISQNQKEQEERMISEICVLVPPEILAQSPSKKDGVDDKVEMAHRIFGCEVVQEGGILLSLPQAVIVTSQNLLQRMFYRYSN